MIPARLTPVSVATPLSSVVALSLALPFSVKLTAFPLRGEPEEVSVALRSVVPPYVPVADVTASDVGFAFCARAKSLNEVSPVTV